MAEKISYIAGRGQGASGGGVDSDRLTALETKIETILPVLATKGDVSEAKADIIKWLAGAALAVVAIIVSVMAFMLNRAIPVQSTQQQAPIIIYPQQSNPPVSQSPPATKRGQ
jgi:hypothetical protein